MSFGRIADLALASLPVPWRPAVLLWSPVSSLRRNRPLLASLDSQREFQITTRFLTWRVAASSQTFDLDQCEFPILGRLSRVNAEVVLDGVKDFGRTASTELTWGGSAQLKEVRGNGFSVVHGVEGCDLDMSYKFEIEHSLLTS